MKPIYALSLITLLFFGCSKDEDVAPEFKGGAEYRVSFTIDWNSTDFPTDYPSNAHFSRLIGWSHNPTQTLFNVGTMASAGIKNMAETGSTSPLNDELAALVEEENGFNYFIGSNLSDGTGTIVLDIEVDSDHPSVTLATMVAPSPDWYVAVVNINLLDGDSFVSEKTLDAHVYDAGTDDGVSFTSSNAMSSPQQPISLFVDSPLGNGTELNATIATVTFTKL